MEVNGGADLHLQSIEDPMPEQADAQRRLWPVGSLCWSRLLVGPVAPWREEPRLVQVSWQGLWPWGVPTVEQYVLKGLYPKGGSHAAAVCEELQTTGRTYVGEIHGELSLVGGTQHRSRRRVWGRPPPEEERATETTCDELTATPIALCHWAGGGREFESKVEPRKKGGVRRWCFKK